MLQYRRRLICLAILVLATPAAVFAQDSQHEGSAEIQELAITGATLIDGTGAGPRSATTIFIRDGRITAVTPDADAEVPAGVTEIDAAGKYVIPGLADMHFHLSLGLPLPREENETDIVLGRALYYGVTTILAIGASDASPESIHAHRARRAAGELQAPYIYGTGGHLTPQGTHPIYTIFPPPIRQKADDLAAEIPENEPVDLYPLGIGLSMVRTEEAARKAVRERAKAGMDAIKITVESGPTPFGDNHPQMSVEMIRAIVEEAAKHGLSVFAHITSLDELQAALEGGAAGVVHTVWDRPFPDAELADRMAAKGFYVTPTTSVYRGTVSLHYIDEPIDLDDPFLRETVSGKEVAMLRDPEFIARFRSRWQRPLASVEDRRKAIQLHVDELLANVGMLHNRGVPIVLGTDTGTLFSFAGYSVHDELEHLVEAGLTPGEALEAATKRAAEMLNAEDEFGTIEAGKRADLLILGANPLDDIRNTRSLETVIAGGRVVDRDSLLTAPTRAPEHLPILDVHLHAVPADHLGPPPRAMCTPMPSPAWDPDQPYRKQFDGLAKDPPCPDPVWSPKTDEAMMKETIAVMERLNIYGVLSDTEPDRISAWREAAPGRFIPGLVLPFGEQGAGFSTDSLRSLHDAGRLAVLGEVISQYAGIAPDDKRMEPYWELAEELDIPVGIHVGTGPPGAPYLGFEGYRARLHSPLTMEEVLVRHPRLRVYLMHAGYPMLDDLLAVLYAHPQVYVDVGIIVFQQPRAEFYRYLRTIVEAGFGDRVMFGSDQIIWPGVIERAVAVINEAPFLDEEQKRDILYNNAARFLRLSEEEIARHHGDQADDQDSS